MGVTSLPELPESNEAARLDALDELARFRDEFYLPPGQIYLDGNSLGLLSRPAEAALLRALHEWKTLGIDGWTGADPPWFYLAESLGAQTAPLIGAQPDEVIVTNSTTVNLHQLIATLYERDSSRVDVLTDALSFPSDLYALQSQLLIHGRDPATHLVTVKSRDGATLEEADIVAAMSERVQMVVLPAVIYTSGQLLDLEYLTREAHRRGILIGFDCSHSIGAVTHAFDAWDVDFAFWCNYKYLNGGPGATGGLYLNRRLFGRCPGLAGWFSCSKGRQFDMASVLRAASDAGALQIGTPNILSMAPLQGALALHANAGPAKLRRKSLDLTRFLRTLIDTELSGYGITIVTPCEDHRRGGHIALRHTDAARICKALRVAGVVPDFRPPDIIRFAPVALYTRFVDCSAAVSKLKEVLESRIYAQYTFGRDLVP